MAANTVKSRAMSEGLFRSISDRASTTSTADCEASCRIQNRSRCGAGAESNSERQDVRAITATAMDAAIPPRLKTPKSAQQIAPIDGVGMVPGDGGAWALPRAVGFANAAEMLFPGDLLSAEQALACGLVSRVVAADELMREARALAGRIAANPPRSLRLAKRLLQQAQCQDLEHVLELSAYQALAHETRDHAEAVAAFVDKRAPQFTGE